MFSHKGKNYLGIDKFFFQILIMIGKSYDKKSCNAVDHLPINNFAKMDGQDKYIWPELYLYLLVNCKELSLVKVAPIIK